MSETHTDQASPPPSATLYFEDFQEGQTFDLGSLTLTTEEIVSFAKNYDPQPFHLDPAAARAHRFGRLIASGWQTAALWNRRFVDTFLSRTVSLGSPGLSNLSWPNPVEPDQHHIASFRIHRLEPSRSHLDVGKLFGEGTMALDEDDDALVLQLSLLILVGRRPGE